MKPNWSLLVTEAGSETKDRPHEEREMGERLRTLQQKWENRVPDTEVSVVTRQGDLIYMGRYYEGVVVRLHGTDGPVTFLTNRQARQFGEWLKGPLESAER